MSSYNLSDSDYNAINNFLKLLNSKQHTNDNKQIKININNNSVNEIHIDLPFFDRVIFDISSVKDYIIGSKFVKMNDMTNKFISSIKLFLSLENISNTDDFDTYFSGSYSIHLKNNFLYSELNESIKMLIKIANKKYYQQCLNILNKFNINELISSTINQSDSSSASTKANSSSASTKADIKITNSTKHQYTSFDAIPDSDDDLDFSKSVNIINLVSNVKTKQPTIAEPTIAEPTKLPTKSINTIKSVIQYDMYKMNSMTDNIKERVNTYTYGLLDHIPFENKNAIFTGGLLFDILKNDPLFDNSKLSDIDIFLFGPDDKKKQTIQQIIDNIKYNYKVINSPTDILVTLNRSVIYIHIKGIPRIVQIICTNRNSAKEVVEQFDMDYIMSFYDGTNIYSSERATKCLESGIATMNPLNKKPIRYCRILKTKSRGLNLDTDLKKYDIMNEKDDMLSCIKYKMQIEFYELSKNLEVENDLYTYSSHLCKIFNTEPFDTTKVILNGDFSNYK